MKRIVTTLNELFAQLISLLIAAAILALVIAFTVGAFKLANSVVQAADINVKANVQETYVLGERNPALDDYFGTVTAVQW